MGQKTSFLVQFSQRSYLLEFKEYHSHIFIHSSQWFTNLSFFEKKLKKFRNFFLEIFKNQKFFKNFFLRVLFFQFLCLIWSWEGKSTVRKRRRGYVFQRKTSFTTPNFRTPHVNHFFIIILLLSKSCWRHNSRPAWSWAFIFLPKVDVRP